MNTNVSTKKIVFRTLVTILLGLSFVIYSMYRTGADEWEDKASAYDTKNEYIVSNYLAVLQGVWLARIGDDQDFIYQIMDGWHKNAMENALSVIPESDGEYYIWKYNYYVSPYVKYLNKKQKINISNKEQRIEIAIDIIKNISKHQLANEKLEHDVFHSSYLSYMFLIYRFEKLDMSVADYFGIKFNLVDLYKRILDEKRFLEDEKYAYYLGLTATRITNALANQIFIIKSNICDSKLTAAYQYLKSTYETSLMIVFPEGIPSDKKFYNRVAFAERAEGKIKQCNE